MLQINCNFQPARFRVNKEKVATLWLEHTGIRAERIDKFALQRCTQYAYIGEW